MLLVDLREPRTWLEPTSQVPAPTASAHKVRLRYLSARFVTRVPTGYRALLGGRWNPLEQPAGEVDCHDRAALVAGEKTALPLQPPLVTM
jgi:hypothetical protein